MNQALDIGIVSDEIDQDFTVAATHGAAWGIRLYEIRCLTSGRIPSVTPQELDAVERIVRDRDLRITGVSPGIFKHQLNKRPDVEREIAETLPATIALAQRFSCPLIIVFGFQRLPGEPASRYDLAVEFFTRAAAMAQASGMRLAVENEPGFWCDTGVNTRKMIRDVGSPSFGANWDPCNAYGTDEVPYPGGYEAIRDVIINVHVKDTLKGSLIQCVPVGDGALDWEGQMNALLRDRPVGHVTIETHCHPLVANSERNVRTLRTLMGVQAHR
jgi:sugar phosphate isomerase/epimerase